MFVYIWMMTSYHGSRTVHQILWLELFLILGYSTSLYRVWWIF